jgi:hypothetical protein
MAAVERREAGEALVEGPVAGALVVVVVDAQGSPSNVSLCVRTRFLTRLSTGC